MNTQNFNQQQPFFEEPAFTGVDGTGKKLLPGEPQFVTGMERHPEDLNALYANQTRTDPYHSLPLHGEQSLPLYGEEKKPIYTDQISGKNVLYPGQENFIGKQIGVVDGKEVLTTGGVTQAAYVPPTHGQEHKSEHVHLSPENQHVQLSPSTEHVHLNPSNDHVHLNPDTEHIHIKAPNPTGDVEQVIRIKPDGKVQVTTEKVVEHPTEHLKEYVAEKHVPKKESKKKHVEEVKHVEPTETTTVVKVSEHEPGTLGYNREGKLGSHDDTHHHGTGSKKDYDNTHHHGTDDTRVKVNKDHHGVSKEEETRVEVNKTHVAPDHLHVETEERGTTKHLKAGKSGKKKRSSKKRQGKKAETKTVVKVSEHEPGTAGYVKEGKLGHDKTDTSKHHGTGETHVKVQEHGRRPSDSTHVNAGIVTKPQDVHETHRSDSGLVQQLRTTLSESDNPNMDVLGELLLRAEAFLDKSSKQKDIDPDARKTLHDVSTLLNTAKQMERHKGIADRLQKISDECQKSLSNMKDSDTPSSVKNASKDALEFVKIWRPVFQLLIRSRDFRQLFVDSLRIAKRVASRNEGIVDDLSQRFVEGESARDIKETAKAHRDQNVNLSMSDDEWEVLQDEIQSVLGLLARNPQYHDAINSLFTLLDMFNANLKDTVPSSSAEIEPHALKAKKETEELVASFTGRETLREFKIRLRRLGHAFNNDPELQRYFTDVKTFILSSKSEEEVRSDAFRQRSRDLVNRGRYLVDRSKDKNEVDSFISIANRVIDNIKNDEYVKELRSRAGIVRSDLTYTDTEGRTKIDVDMLAKLQHVLMPVLAETFKKIQIPRIESSDKRLDFWVDNIVLCGYDIFPDNIKFHVERDSELSIREIETKGSHTRLVVQLEQLRTEIKNIEFYFKRKTFPSISDSGLVTFRIPENGAHLGIYFTIENRPGETHPRLTEGYADFTIRKMDIEFDKSTLKHDVLLPMATTIMKPIIQSRIERAVETNLTNMLKQLGDRLTSALGEVNRPLFGNMGSVKETIKASEPVQELAHRKSILE